MAKPAAKRPKEEKMKHLNKLTGKKVIETIIEESDGNILRDIILLWGSNFNVLSLKARSILMDKFFSNKPSLFDYTDRACNGENNFTWEARADCKEENQRAFFACLHLKYSFPPPDDKIIEKALKIGGEKTARNIFKIIRRDPKKIILFTKEAKKVIRKYLFIGGNEERILENENDYQRDFIEAVKALCAE